MGTTAKEAEQIMYFQHAVQATVILPYGTVISDITGLVSCLGVN